MDHEVSGLTFEILTKRIKGAMRRSAKDAVQIGYMLNRVMEDRLYVSEYVDFDTYLAEELHIDYTMATRFIRINKKFASRIDGMEIAQEYEDYSQGLLVEMLNMTPEQEAKVTPDMTVRQAREIKRQDKAAQLEAAEIPEEPEEAATSQPVPEGVQLPGQLDLEKDFPEYLPEEPKKEEIIDAEFREVDDPETPEEAATSQPLSAYGLPARVYPPESLINTPGCGMHDCFSCGADCGIRQEKRHCCEAPCGNPFACDTMDLFESLKKEIGAQCQFVEQDMAEHYPGSGEADPCCKNCENPCEYQCGWAADKREKDGASEKIATSQPDENADMSSEEEVLSGVEGVRRILEEQKKNLNDMLLVDKVEPLPADMVYKQKTIVAALAAMICDLEREEEAEGFESWLKLPCKYGDTVYVLPTKENGLQDITEMTCLGFYIGEPNSVANLAPKNRRDKSVPKMYQPAMSDFAKTVFLTHQEAAAVMKGKDLGVTQ